MDVAGAPGRDAGRYRAGETKGALAVIYGVSLRTVGRVCTGTGHGDGARGPAMPGLRAALSGALALESDVRRLQRDGPRRSNFLTTPRDQALSE